MAHQQQQVQATDTYADFLSFSFLFASACIHFCQRIVAFTHSTANLWVSTHSELSEDVIALAYRLGKKIYHIDSTSPYLLCYAL
jgi:hypothetical protein